MRRVLIIHADPVSARRQQTFWIGRGAEVRTLTDSREAAFQAGQWRPDVITLDSDCDGLACEEVLRQLRSRAVTCRTPVILLVAADRKPLAADVRGQVALEVIKPCPLESALAGWADPGLSVSWEAPAMAAVA